MMSERCPGDFVPYKDDNATLEFFNATSSVTSSYVGVHRLVVPAICTVGVVLNIVHILVLTRKRLRASAVNNILAAIAFCDVLTMASQLVYLWRFKFFTDEADVGGYPFGWVVFRYIHPLNSISMHGASLYLCALTAFVRWIAIERLNSTWADRRVVWCLCAIIFIAMVVLAVPSVLVYPIWSATEEAANRHYIIHIIDDRCRLLKLYLLQSGIIFKVVPCVFLFFFTVGLLLKLREAKKNRLALREGRSSSERAPSNDRTTFMLILMLTVFLITELPQGVIAILIALFASDVYSIVFSPLMQLLNLMSLVNCNVGYVLYPVMSSAYRAALRDLFLPRKPLANTASESKTL